MSTLVIKVPDKNTPGFARRLYRAAGFQQRVQSGEFSTELITDMIDFLSDYIEGDKEKGKEYLWDCTETQFNEMIAAVSGGGSNETPPVVKSEALDTP